MVAPEELISRSPALFSFYLKVRKYVFTNFVNDRDSNTKSLSFGKIR